MIQYIVNRFNNFMYIIAHVIPSEGGRDRMVVRFTTAYVISAHHHCCYVFESRSGRGVQHYVIKFVSDLRQVSDFVGSTGLLHQ